MSRTSANRPRRHAHTLVRPSSDPHAPNTRIRMGARPSQGSGEALIPNLAFPRQGRHQSSHPSSDASGFFLRSGEGIAPTSCLELARANREAAFTVRAKQPSPPGGAAPVGAPKSRGVCLTTSRDPDANHQARAQCNAAIAGCVYFVGSEGLPKSDW